MATENAKNKTESVKQIDCLVFHEDQAPCGGEAFSIEIWCCCVCDRAWTWPEEILNESTSARIQKMSN